MKKSIIFTVLFFISMAGGAFPKDLSRVPAKGDPPLYGVSIEVCEQRVTVKKRKRETRLHLSRTHCRRLPAWYQPKLRVSWSNVFREMQRARECDVPLFSNKECNG